MRIHLTNEELAEVTSLAAVFFTPKEIAVILKQPVDLFEDECKEHATQAGLAFWTGWLQSEYEQRKAIVSLAKSGSSPAQTMVQEMIKQGKLKMIS
jgi:hypothetical protein